MKESSPSSSLGKRKGRPPKRKQNSTNDDINFLDDESDLSFDEYLDTSDGEASAGNNRKRARSASKSTYNAPPPLAMAMVENDDSDIDETGEAKVNPEGHLLEGREYRVPTFELPSRGRQLFMFSKDPAALLGFRDSFVFVKKNPTLIKIYMTDEEKRHLIANNKMRATFRTRDISVVTARSVYKVFGHRVVKKGRRGRDDYYYTGEYDDEPEVDSEEENKEKLAGLQTSATALPAGANTTLHAGHHAFVTANLLANPLASSSTLIPSDNDQSHSNLVTPVSLAHTLEPLDKRNWLHHAAVSARDFSAQLSAYRQNHPTFFDLHTNVYQIPSSRQYSSCDKPFVSSQ
ncbi:hypothetical protein DM01DRAFT_1380486 [Hesseltinella vesiculosa]|uniref:Uncharacterized protein n=1 Tax=Hesseltinella vesiculosa TaxID=101127 RepID=A0A1X2GUD2_9FUNG|nr:hypothetical protein DM01DRAFT_1380486 [Hesseltinella vesiculosa]